VRHFLPSRLHFSMDSLAQCCVVIFRADIAENDGRDAGGMHAA
jgi:hypothetical protein